MGESRVEGLGKSRPYAAVDFDVLSVSVALFLEVLFCAHLVHFV